MSDWQIGGLAVCVDASNMGVAASVGYRLREGAAYTVLGVTGPKRWCGGYAACPSLIIDGPRNDSSEGGWHPSRFRKIRPDEHQACEEEFVTLLKRSKRSVEA